MGGCEIHTRQLALKLAEQNNINIVTVLNNQEDKLNKNLCLAVVQRAPAKPDIYYDGTMSINRIGLRRHEKIVTYLIARTAGKHIWFSRRYLERFFSWKLNPHIPGETDIIHFIHGGVSLLGLGGRYLTRKRNIPFVMTPLLHLHQILGEQPLVSTDGKVEHVVFDHYKLPTRQWHDTFWVNLIREADALITLTDFETECLHHNGVSRKKLHKLGVGPVLSEKIDPEGFRTKWSIGDRPLVLFVGRLCAGKGINGIVLGAEKVWTKYPETMFVFIGPIDHESAEFLASHTDSRIVCTGPVDLGEKSSALAACDIFCMPSRYESLGGTYLESWVYEKPVIAANIPTSKELTGNGKGGILVDEKPASISQAILYLLDHPEEAQKMGKWGNENVLSRYNWDVISENLEKVYMNLNSSRHI
jgi:glycosyltransferase involved in cell wall biosynthesis